MDVAALWINMEWEIEEQKMEKGNYYSLWFCQYIYQIQWQKKLI